MTHTIQDWMAQARAAELQHDVQQATQCYRQVLAHDPCHLDAVKGLGLLLRQAHAWTAVIELYRSCLAVQPSAMVYVWLADMFERTEQHDEARLAATKALFYFQQVPQPFKHALDYFWWIKAGVQADQPQLALHAFKVSIEQQKSPAQHRLFEGLVIDWLKQSVQATPAQPLDAIELCLLLDTQHALTPTLQQHALKIAHQYAIYHPQVVRWARQIAQQPRPLYAPIIEWVLDFWVCAEGVTDEVLAAYRTWRWQHQPSARFLLNYAQVLLSLSLFDELRQWIIAAPELLQYDQTHPAIAWMSLQIQPDAELPIVRALWHSYQQVQQQTEQAWSSLAQGSLAVVGNSPCELGAAQGAAIDQHAQVVRFNAFDLSAPYDQDYGRRVDWVVRSAASDANLELDPQYQHKTVVISYIGFLARFRGWPLVQRLQAAGHRVCCYPAALHQGLITTLQRSPSAGLSVVWLLKQLRAADAPVVDYYGFAFTDQVGNTATSSHYFEQAVPSLRHAWQQERQYFEQWARLLTPIKAPTPQGLAIKLIGDHAAYHGGSAAVTAYIEQGIATIGHRVGHDPYDVLLVNGEGSMHHRSNAYLQKMRQITLALIQQKPVWLLNSVWQDNQPHDQDIVAKIQHITLRESLSQADLLHSSGRTAPAYLDCSYWAPVDETVEYTDFANQTVCTDFYSAEFETFVKVTGGILTKYPYIDMQAYSWSALVRSLRTASLLVTGRHHAVYAACRARLPFVVMVGNTHKIEGLLAMAGVDIPVCRHPRELRETIIWARKNKAVYQQLFDWMEAQPRWQLHDFILNP